MTPDLLWHSGAPWDSSAYGGQSSLVCSRLRAAGYRIDLSCPTGGGLLVHDGVRHWPAPGNTASSMLSNARMAFEGRPQPPVVAFTDLVRLTDANLGELDLTYWFPFNFEPVPEEYLEVLRATRPRLLVPSRWAGDLLDKEGLEAVHVPHGVDPSVFRPCTPEVRRELRLRHGFDPDAFVVGMVAANVEWVGNRKSLPEALAAFAVFQRTHPEAVLFLHTDVAGTAKGIDLHPLVASLGIPTEAIAITDQDRYRAGLPAHGLAELYATFDVLLAPSAGEGFGIPVLEAQACGTRVIASRFSAQTELVGDGWLVGGQLRWVSYAESWMMTPDVGQIVEALEAAHRAPREPSTRARTFAGNFDIDRLVERHWLPHLERWIGPPA